MNMQDPIADMLTRIRNAHMRSRRSVRMPLSRLLKGIAETLQEEGYIASVQVDGEGALSELVLGLRYIDNQPVIRELKRLSRPSLRRYSASQEIAHVRGGLGIIVMSTNQGIMSSRRARELGVGGECLCSVF
ncbi:MAG: 30S ribosomal protein S8 [Gammaproteobacteria bacterium]